MKTEWFKGIEDEKEIEKIKSSVRSSHLVLEQLIEICSNKIEELNAVNLKDYDSPSWSEKQAHINGMNEAYRKIIALCTLN